MDPFYTLSRDSVTAEPAVPRPESLVTGMRTRDFTVVLTLTSVSFKRTYARILLDLTLTPLQLEMAAPGQRHKLHNIVL